MVWDKDPNVRIKIIKLLEENIGVSLFSLGIGIDFLKMTLKAQVIKENTSIGFHQNEKLVCLRRHYWKNEKTSHRLKNYSQIIYSSKDLYSKYIKSSYNSIIRRYITSLSNGQKWIDISLTNDQSAHRKILNIISH